MFTDREKANCRVTIVIPAFNAASYLPHQLAALYAQDSTWIEEVVVVNNASTDATRDVAERWQLTWKKLVILDEPRPGGNAARNTGVRASRTDLVLMCDADDVVGNGWASTLRLALMNHDLARGRYELERLNSADVRAARGPVEAARSPINERPLKGLGGNCAFRRAVWLRMGGFNEDHYGSDDEEFFWRAQLAGYRAVHVDEATVHYRLRPEISQLYRQQKSWASNRAQLYREFREFGFIERRSVPQAIKSWAWLAVHIADALSTEAARRGRWIRCAAGNTGRIHGSLRHRVFYP